MVCFSLIICAVSAFLLVNGQLQPAFPAEYKRLPSLREQAAIQDQWRAERMSRVPALLKKYGVDAWLMSQREHAEDTLWWSIKNATDYDVHRRTVLLFHTNSSSLAGRPNPLIWIDNTGQVWPELRQQLEKYTPERIAINVDRDLAFSGGLHVGELAVLEEELGEKWMSRTVNIPMMSVEFVSDKGSGQIDYYRDMQESVWAMLEEGFSHRVIDVGVTSTLDLEWWFREKMLTINVTTWNHPRVSVIKSTMNPGWEGTDDVIQEGDMLHIDMGITAMGMNTDTQHLAYVLRSSIGETDAPDGLKAGLKKSNRMQDIVLEKMQAGLTGDAVLRKCLDTMKSEEIEGQIYSHPIGDWGHDAGAVMGFTNLPEHVPILGELPILPNTFYSIELYASHFVPEKNETLKFLQEEDVSWVAETQTWKFVRGRQEIFHIVDQTKRASSLATKEVIFRVQT
ncbi:hypothetical protein BDZ89DRAFT_1106870 [Hymenopellis radicata]|nr:hypothetical protein BDZ89DRAFT_1106870 [Hymenopellis radicata]